MAMTKRGEGGLVDVVRALLFEFGLRRFAERPRTVAPGRRGDIGPT